MKKNRGLLALLITFILLAVGVFSLRPFWGSEMPNFVMRQVSKYLTYSKNKKPKNVYIGEPSAKLVVPADVHLLNVPEEWNGVYTGKLGGKPIKVLVANGSITYAVGYYYKKIPHMITVPEYYLYQGIHPVITYDTVTIQGKKGPTVFSFTNGQITITENGIETGSFVRVSGFTAYSVIPSKWSGVYIGVVGFMGIRAWAAGGSFTVGLGNYNGKRIIITLPEQAYYTGYPFTVTEDRITASIPPLNAEMELMIASNKVAVWGNGKKIGSVMKD
jgi:hypothetical protein